LHVASDGAIVYARACVTGLSVELSCCIYPRTLSTRFGIRSWRQVSGTSISAHEFRKRALHNKLVE
jgi:hypothetical protein